MTKLLLASIVVVSACHKTASEPPPAKPASGAPIVFVGSDVKAAGDHAGSVHVKAYNFSDKRVAEYGVLLRYHDASGALLKVKPGTPFEADFDHWGFSGQKYLCAPKSWCTFQLDHLDVPDKAASVEIVPSTVTAIAGDNIHFEDKPLYEASMTEWPK